MVNAKVATKPEEQASATEADNHPLTERPWNYAILRQLLNNAFSDEELTTLCFDYFPSVYDTFGTSMSKSQKIQNLIEHCKRNLGEEHLLEIIHARNPAQFARFEPRLHS